MVLSLIFGVTLAAPSPSQVAAQSQNVSAQNPPNAAPGAKTGPAQVLDIEGNPLPSDVQDELSKQFGATAKAKNETPSEPATRSTTASTLTPDGAILVKGKRPRGSVISEITPVRTFSPLEIDAYGASNVKELIQALGSQVSSSNGRGDTRPITLLNGRRVSSFAEIAEIPAEAIERMDVFPEELALRYGFRANQKVVNIVTFERFRSDIGQLGVTLATEGGYGSGRFQGNHFAIAGDTRFDLGLEFNDATSLLESERGLAQYGPTPSSGDYRTLLPATDSMIATALVSGNALNDLSYTLSGGFELSDSKDLLGRTPDATLERDRKVRTGKLGTTLHGNVTDWLWTFAGTFEGIRTRINSNSSAFGRARGRSDEDVFSASLLLNGSFLSLPAGPLAATIRSIAERRSFSSSSPQRDGDQRADLARSSGSLQANLSMPILNRRSQGRNSLGSLSLNANAEIEHLSDFGPLRTYGFGLFWSPVPGTSLTASTSHAQTAPTMEQLGAPSISTPAARVFDYFSREVVEVQRISGGNPDLLMEESHLWRVGVNTRPLPADLTLSLDFIASRTENPIAQFAILRPEVERAFPDRFKRGGDGRISQIDDRPLNFANGSQKQMRWGISYVRPLGKVEPWMRSAPVRTYTSESEARAAAPPGAMVTMVQPGSAMARRFEDMSSRLSLSVYHTWQLQDRVRLREGERDLDVLDGGTLDLLGGGRRHRIEIQAGVFKKGLGARATFNWQSGTSVREAADRAGTLKVAPLSTLDFQLFANLADRIGAEAPEWLKGSRATFSISNLLNSRPQVRYGDGLTPLTYQPAYLNPLGRSISLTLRKAF